MKSIYTLQVLRGIAAWLVVFHHYMQMLHDFKYVTWAGRFFVSQGTFGVDLFFILLTLLFTVYGQLVLKWQMGGAGPLPQGGLDKVLFLLQQFLNPWIMSGFISAFLASLAWMAAMTRFDLNYAYPYMSLAFIIVMLFTVLFLGESLTTQRIIGTLLVVAGLIVCTR